MNNRELIELHFQKIAENTVIEASSTYNIFADDMTEAAFYKNLERFCKNGSLAHLTKGLYYKPKKSKYGYVPIRENDIIAYYTDDQNGLVIGYTLYNKKGITTQIGKYTEVYSNRVSGQKKTVQNVLVRNISCDLNPERVAVIEALEILQNYSKIEDVNKRALIAYMDNFAKSYSDNAAIYVLERMKYKKATIAFLESFLNYLHVSNTLNRYLSSMSVYAIPTMEEIYEASYKRR